MRAHWRQPITHVRKFTCHFNIATCTSSRDTVKRPFSRLTTVRIQHGDVLRDRRRRETRLIMDASNRMGNVVFEKWRWCIGNKQCLKRKEKNFFIPIRPDRRFSSRTCHHISRNIVSPFFSVGPRDPCYPRISLASCLPHFRHHGGQCPPFFPLIAPPFLHSSRVGERISLDDVWTTCIQCRSWQKRGRVLYSRWKERILSSVGYRSGFRELVVVRTRWKEKGLVVDDGHPSIVPSYSRRNVNFWTELPLCRPKGEEMLKVT